MKPLKKGDPVKVRLHTGEIVDADYDELYENKRHWVFIEGDGHYIAGSHAPDNSTRVRFVGNPCVLVPIEVSL